MILGMTTSTYTAVHVILSLIGIGTGLIVMFGLLGRKRLDGWTALFLVTTAATSLTAFGFPNEHITPGIVVGIVSLVALAVAVVARYARHLAGSWRGTYVVSAMLALYLNVFVAIVQSFEKVPTLNALAPKGSEPPFLITQVGVMALFVALSILAGKRFRPGPILRTA